MTNTTSLSLDAPAIGILDSGVGGLSIFDAVRRRLPGLRYHYCSDNLHFPYGVRAEDDVVQCTLRATTRFIDKCSLDILVIACNTMSTVALPQLRQRLKIPVVGVVPAIKPAAAATKTGTIALLATPGTVTRPYTDELIAQFASQCHVIKTGSSKLVDAAERKLRGERLRPGLVAEELARLFDASPTEPDRRVDTVVLGCTHFPLLLPELTEAARWPVTWVDSSDAIAARTDYLVTEKGLKAAAEESVKPWSAFFTKADAGIDALRPALMDMGFSSVEVL